MIETQIRVILLGDVGVGRTSIIRRIRDEQFRENEHATIGFDYRFVKIKYERKNALISLKINEVNGQEIAQFQYSNFISESHIILLVFSDFESLDVLIKRWYKYYEKYRSFNSRIILIGNKCDIFGDQREEIIKQGQNFADKIDAFFLTISAKTMDNMDNLKRYITNEAKRIFDEEEEKMHIKDDNKIKIKLNKPKKTKSEKINDNHNMSINNEDRNKVSQWKNQKLNKYLSF